jgi:Protein of unknown function (DUF3426)
MNRRRFIFFGIIGCAALIVVATLAMEQVTRWARSLPRSAPIVIVVTATPKPSLPTVTPTFAVVPEDVPIPIPTPLRLDAQVSPFTFAYNSIGALYFFGEITNTGEVPLGHPQVSVVLYDAAGQALGNEPGYATQDFLAPGQRAPVKVLFRQPPEWTTFKVLFKPEAARYNGFLVYTDLSPSEMTFARDPSLGYSLSGMVKNTGERQVRFVQVLVTLYDAEGKVVGVDGTFARPNELAPGESAPFKVSFYLTSAEPTSYRAQFIANAP